MKLSWKTLSAAGLVVSLGAVSPALLGAQNVALTGATIHPVSAEPFVGVVLTRDGRIESVGAGVEVPAGYQRYELGGLHVYPGMVDSLSQLGLTEISSVDATVDTSEMGGYNAHLDAATAVHPDSELFPVARAGGVTHTLVGPRAGDGGVVAGRASLLQLDGWTVEEMLIEPSLAMVVQWPEIQTRSFDFATFTVRNRPYKEAQEEAEEKIEELRQWLDAARHYAQAAGAGSDRLDPDLQLEGLSRVLDGALPVVFLASAKRDIEAVLDFAEQEGLDPILGGGRDAWKVRERLAAADVPVILGLVAALPVEEDDPYDQPFRNAALLREAGVRIAFGSGVGGGREPGGAHSSRTLPFEAGTAVGYGLARLHAIEALTLGAAEILGVDDRLGSIEVGKVANLIVVDGDPLQVQSEIRHVFINGREVDTANKHLDLYERYSSRPAP